MKFISNYCTAVITAKSRLDALKVVSEMYDFPDFKVYWEGNNPIGIPFPYSRRAFRMYSITSKMGKALLEQRGRYGLV